jgi:ketosteroid isomerase-like protein
MNLPAQDAEADICALFAAYGAGFDDADAEAVTRLFAWPTTIWQFGKGHVFEDAADLAENVEALIDVFDEAGIKTTTPEVKEIRIAGAAAFAVVIWRQRDDAGELLHEFSCQYLLLSEEGFWRIATIVNEAPREASE